MESVELPLGRWSSAEHDMFIQGLKKHGKDWKAIANDVRSGEVSLCRFQLVPWSRFGPMRRSISSGSITMLCIARALIDVDTNEGPSDFWSPEKQRHDIAYPTRFGIGEGGGQ